MELLFAALHSISIASFVMTPLRQRMLEDMGIRNLAKNTQSAYVQHVVAYAKHFHRSPDVLGLDEVRAYQVHLTQTRMLSPSECQCRHRRAALPVQSEAQTRLVHLGRVVELASAKDLYAAPGHPYTRALIASAPLPDPRATSTTAALEGSVPSAANPPGGCHFHARCAFAQDRCRTEPAPMLEELLPGHFVRCWRAGEI